MVPRQLPLQLARRERPPLQRRGPAEIWQWDDGEVTDHWSPSKVLDTRYTATDVPLLVGRATTAFGRPRFENGANSDRPPLGRELEIQSLLAFSKRNRIKNVVWLTADVHYCAALQFFGQVDIDRLGAMTVSLVDVAGTTIFERELKPSRCERAAELNA